MKNLKRNSIIIFILTLFLMWYILKDNFTESINLLKTSNLFFIFLAIMTYVINFILEAFIFKKIVNQYKEDYTLNESIRLQIETKFFNGITPFATGGQPLQVYELKKDGIKVTSGTTIIVEHFIIFQTSIVIMAVISIIINSIFNFAKSDGFLTTLTILGLALNILLLAIAYILSINKNTNKKIITLIIKLLYKLKIIKSKDELIGKWENACNEYYEGFLRLRNNKKLFIKLIAIEIFSLIIWFLMPIFIFKALNYAENMNILICILISTYVFFVGSYIPIPGGTGGMEFAFVGFFDSYIPMTYLSPALIIWRFINYYAPMLLGGLVFNIKKDRNIKKS